MLIFLGMVFGQHTPGRWNGTHFGRPAVFTSTQIRSGVSWFERQSVKAVWHGFQEARIHVTRAKTGASRASGGRLPSWLSPSSVYHLVLKVLFLGECWRGPRHFWEYRACLGFGPALGTTLNMSCVTLARFVRHASNTCSFPLEMDRSSWPAWVASQKVWHNTQRLFT